MRLHHPSSTWFVETSLSPSLLTGDLFILESRHKDTRRWLLAALRWSERGGKGKKKDHHWYSSSSFVHFFLFRFHATDCYSNDSMSPFFFLKKFSVLLIVEEFRSSCHQSIRLSIHPFVEVCFIVLFFVCWKVYFIIRSIMSMIASNKSECRKVRKPKIEKLRRARINSSLEALKEILLRNTVSIPQGSRPTKLEKADILEMTVRYVELLHDKLSISSSCEVSTRQSMETTGPVEWVARRARAFGDITNQTDKRHRQTTIVTDDKAWFNNRFHRLNSRATDDKENLTVVLRRQNQSMLGEHHWRPWW